MTDHDARAIAEQISEWAKYCFTKHGNDAHLYNGLSDLAGVVAAALHAAHQAGKAENSNIVDAAEQWLKWRDERQRIIRAGDYGSREWQDAGEAFGNSAVALVLAVRARAEEHKAK